MPARNHTMVQNPEDQNTFTVRTIKHHMLPLLHAPATWPNAVTSPSHLWRQRYPGKAVCQFIEIADRLSTPNTLCVIGNCFRSIFASRENLYSGNQTLPNLRDHVTFSNPALLTRLQSRPKRPNLRPILQLILLQCSQPRPHHFTSIRIMPLLNHLADELIHLRRQINIPSRHTSPPTRSYFALAIVGNTRFTSLIRKIRATPRSTVLHQTR